MTLIIIAITIWSASALIRSAREKSAREKAQRIASEQARIKRDMREMKQRANEEVAARIALEREQMRQRREQERLSAEQAKQAEQIAKHEKRIADLEHKMKDAEADILAEQARLDHYTAKLADLDEQLAKIDTDIEFYQRSNGVDKEASARVERKKIEDKIFSFEEKVRACEKRMSKAQYTIDTARRELSA